MLRLQSSASFSNLQEKVLLGALVSWAASAGTREVGRHLLDSFSNVTQMSELCGVVQTHLWGKC